MAETTNQTLRLLRELRTAIKALDTKVDGNHADLKKRVDNIYQALNGESILGRYAVAEVDERLEAIEKRITALEAAD